MNYMSCFIFFLYYDILFPQHILSFFLCAAHSHMHTHTCLCWSFHSH